MRPSLAIQQHRNEILSLAQKHGAENLRIFGSVARGEDIDGSDLDLLVTLGKKQTPFFPGGLIADLQDILNCDVDVVTEEALHKMIRDAILLEAKPL